MDLSLEPLRTPLLLHGHILCTISSRGPSRWLSVSTCCLIAGGALNSCCACSLTACLHMSCSDSKGACKQLQHR